MAEAVMEEVLCAGDFVGGGGSSGARDGFGAYGTEGPGSVAGIVPPCSITPFHLHAVLAPALVARLAIIPVCERAVLFH